MAACSQLSYYLVTAVQIDSSFVYYLSILMIETEFIVLALKRHAQLRVITNYIPCAVVISTTLTLLSVYAIHITHHSLFHGSRSSNFDFLANVSNFFVIKKRVKFCLRFRIFVEVESRDFGGFCTYQTYMLTFRVHTFGSVNY